MFANVFGTFDRTVREHRQEQSSQPLTFLATGFAARWRHVGHVFAGHAFRRANRSWQANGVCPAATRPARVRRASCIAGVGASVKNRYRSCLIFWRMLVMSV